MAGQARTALRPQKKHKDRQSWQQHLSQGARRSRTVFAAESLGTGSASVVQSSIVLPICFKLDPELLHGRVGSSIWSHHLTRGLPTEVLGEGWFLGATAFLHNSSELCAQHNLKGSLREGLLSPFL